MKRKLIISLLSSTALSCIAAELPPEDNILSDLSRCDAKFFSTLKSKAGQLSAIPQFEVSGNYAHFNVPNRFGEESSTSKIQPPVKIGSFEAVAYFDELWTMPAGGRFVAWGFVLNAKIDDVVRALKPLLMDNSRLVSDGPAYVRSEVWEHAKSELGWQKIQTESGEPKPGTVERVLLIEPYERVPNQTRFGCSIQGAVTKDMIQVMRPDLQVNKPTQP